MKRVFFIVTKDSVASPGKRSHMRIQKNVGYPGFLRPGDQGHTEFDTLGEAFFAVQQLSLHTPLDGLRIERIEEITVTPLEQLEELRDVAEDFLFGTLSERDLEEAIVNATDVINQYHAQR